MAELRQTPIISRKKESSGTVCLNLLIAVIRGVALQSGSREPSMPRRSSRLMLGI